MPAGVLGIEERLCEKSSTDTEAKADGSGHEVVVGLGIAGEESAFLGLLGVFVDHDDLVIS